MVGGPCHHYKRMIGTVTSKDFLLKKPLCQPTSMRATAAETAASKILHGHAMALALDSQDLPGCRQQPEYILECEVRVLG